MNYYAPVIFSNLGITGTAQSLFATGVYGIVKMVSCIIFIVFLADTLGRKWSFIWTGVFMGIVMFYLGFYVRFDPPVAGAAVPPAGYVALVAIYLFAAAFQLGELSSPLCSSSLPSQLQLQGTGINMLTIQRVGRKLLDLRRRNQHSPSARLQCCDLRGNPMALQPCHCKIDAGYA